MTRDEFVEKIKELNISYTTDMLEKLEVYANYLLEYNEHTNLTAIRNIDEVYLKHFYDSLTLVKAVDLNTKETLLDIGSGAGFPGMVLKIFFPHLQVTLLDSNNKKTTFLKNVVDKLGLSNITIINDRVENFAKSNLNSFDVVTARAVTNLPVLTELAMPLVKNNCLFIAMKGKAEEEIKSGESTIKAMGGKLEEIINFSLMNNEGTRTLIKIKKLVDTNLDELRSYDKIIKKPR